MKHWKKISISILILIIIGYCGLHIVNFINHTKPYKIDSKDKDTIRIVAANINFENSNKLRTTKLLLEINADILIILEYSGTNIDLLYLAEHGYKAVLDRPINSPHGICVITKDKLQIVGSLIKIPHKNPCQMPFATLRFKQENQYISVWGVHTPPPVPTCEFKTGATIEKLASYVSNGRLIRDLGISQRGDIIVMAGDFNMFWFHPSISKLKKTGLNDTYMKNHLLPATTWSPFFWFPQFVGLDYIFCSNQFSIINSYIFKIDSSDHSGVAADINLR